MRLTRSIVLGAKQLIDEPKKWTKGQASRWINGYSTGDGISYCLGGALARAATGSSMNMYQDDHYLSDFAERANLPNPRSTPVSWLVEKWNDDAGRKYDDVISLLDEVLETFE